MRDDDNFILRLLNYQLPVGRWLMGIPVSLHWTIFFLPVMFYYLLVKDGAFSTLWQPLLSAFIFAFLIVGFVYLHECGHAFAWRLYDHRVRHILLTPLGGVCLGMPPRTAREELVITFFGPLVNLCFLVVFLGALFLWEWAAHRPLGLEDYNGRFDSFRNTGLELLTFMVLVNFMLAAFNLLVPMFPMDCGRILRATLANWHTPLRATEIAVRVGMVTAVLVIIGGVVLAAYGEIMGGVQVAMLAVILMFVARRELEMARIQPVYIGNSAAYGVVWQEAEEDTEEWKLKGEGKAKPGMIARWLAKRQAQREEQAIKEAEDTRRRVDQLLEKISREGIGALSKKERTFLSGASKSFRNRVG